MENCHGHMLFKIVAAHRCLSMLALLFALDAAAAQLPDTVNFPSKDGKTQLVGYLFKPQGAGPHPAIVMLHGRVGPYSSGAKGVYAAHTLSGRHQTWAEFWAERGYLALHVDSFGPRGYPQGFPARSYNERPAAVSEQTVRPLDAYGALEYLRGRGDVIADRVGVQGWSNGAMTLLATLADTAPGITQPTPQTGFRAALALYPGCREQEKQNYRPYAPLLLLLASEDGEVSPVVCQRFAQQTQARGAQLEVVVYAGAQHSFDDPGSRKQANDANRAATRDARIRAEQFFAQYLLK